VARELERRRSTDPERRTHDNDDSATHPFELPLSAEGQTPSMLAGRSGMGGMT
jgi:hypothetical protein